MYPINNYKYVRRGYTHGQKTTYSNFHLGVDLIVPTGTPIYAPTDCVVTTSVGTEGGNTIYATFNGLVMRCLHLSKFAQKGNAKKGQIIGYSGNTGSLTTGPHIHLDLSPAPFNLNRPKAQFLDPDKYNWEQFDTPPPPVNTNPMPTHKFELFAQKSGDEGRVYFRTWDNVLIWIPTPQDLEMYFGKDAWDRIQKVDDIRTAGIRVIS